jgi:small subunit ribosomal protein S11
MNQSKKNNIDNYKNNENYEENKDIAIININSTKNNTLLHVKNIWGIYIMSLSVGLILKKKKGKGSVVFGGQMSSETISSKLINLGYTRLYLKIKGYGRGRESTLYSLSCSGLTIEQLLDVTPRPHNGCRAKKSRRI